MRWNLIPGKVYDIYLAELEAMQNTWSGATPPSGCHAELRFVDETDNVLTFDRVLGTERITENGVDDDTHQVKFHAGYIRFISMHPVYYQPTAKPEQVKEDKPCES